jgi:glutaredoxin
MSNSDAEAELSTIDAPTVAARLRHHGAVLFGTSACAFTSLLRKTWEGKPWDALSGSASQGATSLEASAPWTYVPCDAGAQAAQLCSSAGVKMTPTIVFAGMSVKGYSVPTALSDLSDIPVRVTHALAKRNTVLYGRESCVWTERQKRVLSRPEEGNITYVNCDEKQRQCDAAGVIAVPAWSIEGSAPIFGYRKLQELSNLAVADATQLGKEATESCSNLHGSRAAVCK